MAASERQHRRTRPLPVTPGEYLKEWMMDHDVTYRQLASDTDVSSNFIYRLLNGFTPMSVAMAIKLERRTGIKSGNWLRMEYEYQMETAENEVKKREWKNQYGDSTKQSGGGTEGAATDE